MIRKIRLTSKFMTSQPGLQTVAIHILPVSQDNEIWSISRREIFFFNNYAENEVRRLVSDIFF